MSKVHKLALARPKSYQDLLVGGLAMPGKVYDSSSIFVLTAAPTMAAMTLFNVWLGSVVGEPFSAAIPILLFCVGVLSVPIATAFHEVTHLMGGNYRRYQNSASEPATTSDT